MGRIVIEQARKVVPVGVENHLAGGNIPTHPGSAFRVIVARVAFANVMRGAIDVRKQCRSQNECNKTQLDYFPGFIGLNLFRSGGRFLPIEKRLQVLHHVVGQVCKYRAATPEILQRERDKQNCEWWKVFRKAFPARGHQQQERGQNKKVHRPLRSFAIAAVKGEITNQHRDQRHVTVDHELAGVVWVPLLADLGGKVVGGDLHARVLVKEIQIVWKVRIDDQAQHRPQQDPRQWLPFEAFLSPADHQRPDYPGDDQQHEHVVRQRKHKSQRQKLPVLSFK